MDLPALVDFNLVATHGGFGRAGRALHERTLGPLAEIIEAEQAVASGSPIPAGKLRVSAPIVLAHVVLS